MRKRTYFKKREREPDVKYNRRDVGAFINYVMRDGKKSVAEKIVYDAFDIVGKKEKESALKIFERAIENASPRLEVVSRRIGGANYQIPREVRDERKYFLAANWIIDAARKKGGSGFAPRLAEELIAAAKGEGEAVKRKQNMHKMAEANRAFASFLR